jgi:penicillin-binding protein 2
LIPASSALPSRRPKASAKARWWNGSLYRGHQGFRELSDYNPNNLAADLQNEDSPFINRAFYAYSVGSAFKLLVAATALEQGVSVGYTFNCEGNIRVGDQLFNCHNTAGHGVMDMRTALQKSCNPYFINLILKIGAQSVAYKASAIGLGRATQFAENYRTQSGCLPGSAELRAPAAAANFGFGQGSLTATPVQMAALVSAIAGSGMAVQPRLIEGYTSDGLQVEHTPVYARTRVLSAYAADTVRGLMVDVVEEGSGKQAKPYSGGAGGKTASAQTGNCGWRGGDTRLVLRLFPGGAARVRGGGAGGGRRFRFRLPPRRF